jgi:hypothetical protein
MLSRVRLQGYQMFFSNQKSQFGKILEGLRLKIVYLLYGHLEYFTDIWAISYLHTYMIDFTFIWYIFSGFGILHHEKSGSPVRLGNSCNIKMLFKEKDIFFEGIRIFICTTCMHYMYALHVCITCMHYMYTLHVCTTCMYLVCTMYIIGSDL